MKTEKMSPAKTETGEDRVKVYCGKNRGRMEVERLRKRLIRELREGEVRKGKGRERMKETENIV